LQWRGGALAVQISHEQSREGARFGCLSGCEPEAHAVNQNQGRRLVANGIDPSAKRQAEKVAPTNGFEAIGREWFAKYSLIWAPAHAKKLAGGLSWIFIRGSGSGRSGALQRPNY
jgi:hypothetical protein